LVLVLSLVSCGDRFAGPGRALSAATQTVTRSLSPSQPSGNISEVSPPEVIQALSQALEVYQPNVAILSPQPDEVLPDNTVTVRLQVKDLPIFKNSELDLGSHLHVILDNQPYIAVYDLNQPLVFPDLPPGTHTLRVFASRPWGESFKNETAYAQTTFHIFTKTQDNNPDSAQPLLTYSSPQGSYGAQPILLDFYLTNAPLHLVAQEKPDDDIADWRIRCTINGNSFIVDRWQPLYLKGFKPGKNWVQLEFLDEQGNTVKNVFNNTVRLITYEPKGKDNLSKLVRGELSATEARGIVDPNYTANIPDATPTPSPSPSAPATPTPTPIPAPTIEKTPPSPSLPPTLPEIIESPAPESIAPQPESTPAPEPLVTPREETSPEVEPAPLAEPQPKVPPEKRKSRGFFNRFRRPAATPSPSLPPTLPESIESPAPEPIVPDVTPQSATPSPSLPPTLPEIIDAPASESVVPKVAPQLDK
jgi:hypothetical protein